MINLECIRKLDVQPLSRQSQNALKGEHNGSRWQSAASKCRTEGTSRSLRSFGLQRSAGSQSRSFSFNKSNIERQLFELISS